MPILKATLVAGTLDIVSAFIFAGVAGIGPVAVLNYVASGPFGDVARHGAGWAVVGLLVHYAIMACMVAAYLLAATRLSVLSRRPVVSGIAYGLLLWVFMYWIVKPLRWPDAPLPHTLYGISNALFSHCILVGLPIALIAARWVAARGEPQVAEQMG
jgi:hypothetical protein